MRERGTYLLFDRGGKEGEVASTISRKEKFIFTPQARRKGGTNTGERVVRPTL